MGHLAAHLVQPMLVGFGRFFLTALRYRGDTDKTVDHLTRQLARRPRAELIALLREHAEDRVNPPRVGPMGSFAETCVHLRDIARPLGLNPSPLQVRKGEREQVTTRPGTESDHELLDVIHGTPWISDLLARFDFDVTRCADGPGEPGSLPGGEPLEMIAGDASGGAFFLVGAGASRPVLYIGSEGEGGLVSAGLRDALAIVVGLPSLHDATAFPLHDDGGRRLRARLADADDEMREDWPDLDGDRTRLRLALGLPPAADLLEALHAAADDDRYRPVGEHGTRYRSKLGSPDESERSEPVPASTASDMEPTASPEAHEPIPGQISLF